ncbi:structural maintenance of chromosomes protein 5-like [Clytia hemisphaerica]|uniref:structural maintenance of chromosomes protein 5-like n=1 Tax=Clytia hemisphaerica TaxID=252671 RepID=UPI0034D6C25B
MSNKTRERLNLQISAVCPPRDAKDQYPPQQRIDNYKRFGFHSYITDLFQCPKTVYQYLCEAFHLHNIPIGVEAIDKNPENVINNTSLFRFYTPNNSYSINKSRYADKKSTSVNTVRKDANLLNPSVDLEVKKQLDTELSQHEHQMKVNNGKLEEISRKENALQKEQEKLRTEKKSLMTQMKKRTTLSNQIETRVKRLDEEKKTKIDIEKEERKFRDKVKKINATRIALVKEYQTVVQRSLEHGKEHIRLNIRRLQVKREVEVAEKNFRIVDSDLNNFIEQFENLSRGHNEAKNRAKKLLDEAKRLTGSTPDSLVPDALNRVFETLPDTIEEIEELICEEEASLNCQFETNPEVIKNYEKNKREISKLETELQDKDGELTEIKNTIEELLQSWLVPLEELINRINERYSDFFRRMGCAGEVLLKRDPNDDYSQYGIQINVKFRAENKMKELTSYFQSGGERSVSTMLYLISLQELTKCPFRLVDEINQGMDPKNERRVFELVVETVCRPNTSQYFLITPKLLPDLHYTEQMTILTVLNGYYMVPHNKFRLHDLIERKRKLNAQGA